MKLIANLLEYSYKIEQILSLLLLLFQIHQASAAVSNVFWITHIGIMYMRSLLDLRTCSYVL